MTRDCVSLIPNLFYSPCSVIERFGSNRGYIKPYLPWRNSLQAFEFYFCIVNSDDNLILNEWFKVIWELQVSTYKVSNSNMVKKMQGWNATLIK
jgi:hypothetical protein